jgi:hypothetical protein
MRTVLVALLALALTPAMVQAGGGGGSKNTGSVIVNNNNTGVANGANTLFVALDAQNNAAIGNALAAGNLNAFLAAGGRVVPPGGSATFTNVQAGQHTLGAAYVNTGVAGAGGVGAVTPAIPVNVPKGGSVTVNLTEGAHAAGGPGGAVTVQ